MKLIKEIVYQEHVSLKYLKEVDDYVDSRRYDDDDFDLYFEVREDDNYVIFANLGGYVRSEEEIAGNEARAIQVETAILEKATGTLYWLQDNNGLENYDCLAQYPYWTREDLNKVGVKHFRESGRGQFDYRHTWGYHS